ncbi:NAD-dependent epimerase/dehydratase family protein [Mesobacillus foraminis]|uniref:NAD-dependent epimerase/dehydratase family protein n=1 Tax=Mesobacillus foraminis TaxID=279826 RepID=UPI0013CEDE80|nr:NAD(P)-dependent oxidoreductase [Mesobacillus foraminis]
MNILVTGGAGFLGSTLVQMLLERGETVISYDRKALESEHDQLTYVQGDLLDITLLLETMRKYEIDRVIHTAAISHPAVAIDIPYQTVLTNALGTTNVFEAARFSGIKRVVNLSSEYAYGSNDHLGTTHEDIPLHPSGVYGATKVFTEKLAGGYRNHYGMEIPSLRPGWIYGPGQFMQCYMKTLLRNAIDGVPTIEQEGKDHGFQYVHVRDVAQACILACTVDSLDTYVYSITAGDKITYGELVSMVKDLYPEADIRVGDGEFTVLDSYATIDISRARNELGYQPKYNLKSGVEMYAKWLESNPF